MKKNNQYLLGNHFTITDNKAVRKIFDPHRTITNCSRQISEMGINIKSMTIKLNLNKQKNIAMLICCHDFLGLSKASCLLIT